MTAILVMNNKRIRCISTLLVPRPYFEEYLSSGIEWLVDDISIPVHNSDHCPLCERHISESSSMRNREPRFVMCPDYEINKKVGYQLRICVDCSWWLRVYAGYDQNKVPKSLRVKLEQGFRPHNIDIYLP